LVFVSMAATKSNLHAKFGAEKQFAAVEHTRDIGKKNMIHNNATPDIEVDPETYEVRAGRGVVDGAKVFPVLRTSGNREGKRQ